MTSRGGSALRVALAAGLALALVAPSILRAPPAAAAEPVVLRVGTVEALDSTNPYQTAVVVGYEAFQLTWNLLVDFGEDLEPVPGFADSWQRAPDGRSWTFHIRAGMRWSDGHPATAADACFSWGLALDAIRTGAPLGLGYLDPGLGDAGVTGVDCLDPTTMVVTTSDASDRVLHTYLPIIPQHVYGKLTAAGVEEESFAPPLVGTGPYTLAEWRPGEVARFVRNPHYWGPRGFEDEVQIRFFRDTDALTAALESGAIDYARDPTPDQFRALAGETGITTVVGTANGWTQLAFNTYGSGTGKTIKGGGPSTRALLDPKFRDALGYAVDKRAIVDAVLGGFDRAGTTVVPPVLTRWHVEPSRPRRFDIELAKRKLVAAGYKLDRSGRRLDRQRKPITLRLYLPRDDATYAAIAKLVVGWYGRLGIKVDARALDTTALTELVLPPEAGAGHLAKYDILLWRWAGNPDPNALLQIFRCDAIGRSSDSNYCNKRYDGLYDEQNGAATAPERAGLLAQLQDLVYDQAVYDILYYDSTLHAYRTDRFAGWRNMPPNGTPLFTFGTLNYTLLTDATVPPPASPTPSAGPSESASAGTGSASPGTASPLSSGSPSASGSPPVATAPGSVPSGSAAASPGATPDRTLVPGRIGAGSPSGDGTAVGALLGAIAIAFAVAATFVTNRRHPPTA